MKKWITCFFTVCLLALALSVTAFAADGIQTPEVKDEYKNTVTITPDGTEKVNVAYSQAENGKEYVVIVTEGNGTPTQDNIVYIDQKTAGSGGVSFSVYPRSLKNAAYSVRISSNAGNGIQALTEVGTFENKVSYVLGDVNKDGRIRANDATLALRAAAGLEQNLDANQLLAADVNRDGRVRANDATMILRFAAGLITSFD